MTDDKMSPERELEEQLKEAGNKLLPPPTSLDELLPLLDQVENLLSRVEQSPAKSMQAALSPLTSALVMDELLRHSNVDVKVAAASCISEITRITAPDAPYDDDKMKDVFQLIVSSFEDLFDESSRSYTKRAMILDTVAKVRSCVVMLDLECDWLIAEMFTHFLGTIRDHHSENVLSSMETIMTLVLDESEDISSQILTPLLACLRKDNQEVLPVAVKLAEKVIEKCAAKLKPYLSQAIKSLGVPLDDYNEVVTTICEVPSSTVEHMNENASTEQLVAKNVNEGSSRDVEHNVSRPSNSVMINGGNNKGNDDDRKDAEVNTKENYHCNEPSADMLVSKSEDDDSETCKPLKFDSKLEDVDMIRGTKPNASMNVSESSDTSHVDGEKEVDDQLDAQEIIEKDLHVSSREDDDTVDASKSSEIEIVKSLSAPEASETDVVTAASPSQSGSLYDKNPPTKVGRLMNKESSLQEETPSLDFVSNKASEGTHVSEAKEHRRSGKKAAAQTAKKEKISAEVDTSKDESGGASDLEKKQVKILGKKVDENSSTMDEHSSKRNMESKRRRHGKNTLENEVTKSSAEDDLKKTSSMKYFSKLAKGESSSEETPRMSSKRKLASSQHKATEDVAYGDNLVGAKVKVWWPKDHQFYEGVIDSFDPVKKKHKVLYNDGDEEILSLTRERWEIINDEVHSTKTACPEAASGMQKREKAKMNPELVTHGKADVSSKSKSKGTSTKYGRKTDDEPKLKDRTPKSGGKTDVDSSVGSKTHSQRIGDKHVHNSSKTSWKCKDADSGISKGKSKQDSTKTGSKSKQDTSRIGRKSKQDTTKTGMNSKSKTPEAGDDDNANGMGKMKFCSKTKETEELKEKMKGKLTDVPKTPEGAKVKLSEMSKVQESEAGRTKKRCRTG